MKSATLNNPSLNDEASSKVYDPVENDAKVGSPQLTDPLSKVSLLKARPDNVLELVNPEEGSEVSSSTVIVSGTVGEGVTDLRYRVNGGETTGVAFANNRFTFTATGLSTDEKTLEVTATVLQVSTP